MLDIGFDAGVSIAFGAVQRQRGGGGVRCDTVGGVGCAAGHHCGSCLECQ